MPPASPAFSEGNLTALPVSGLFNSLHSSARALAAHSRAIETVGKNLANVNNASYARQRVMYGDRGSVATSTGAESLALEAMGVEQTRDSLLDRQVMREIALKASFETEQGGYQRAQAGLGESIDRTRSAGGSGTGGGAGLTAAVVDFFNAFQGFAARPTDSGERQTLLQKSALESSDCLSQDKLLSWAGDRGPSVFTPPT